MSGERTRERTLIARAAGGDAEAFTDLVRAHDRSIRSAAYNVILDPWLVDDVVQDAYLLAFRRLDQFRGDSSFGTWLHRITTRAAIDHLRRHRRQQPLDAFDTADRELGPEARSVNDDLVGRALAAITPEQREAVVLVDQLGMAYEEAADTLGIEAGTVASRVSRARRRMRETLAGDDAMHQHHDHDRTPDNEQGGWR
jgi:RNA polymerase sigma-70 factor, ECF subfamily